MRTVFEKTETETDLVNMTEACRHGLDGCSLVLVTIH